MAKTITTALQAANAKTGSWRVGTATGLYLTVGETGARSWVYRYRFNGKRRYMGLGAFKDVSLAEARDKAAEARRQHRNNVDPIEARREEKAAALATKKALVNFVRATDSFIEDHAPSWKHKYAGRVWRNPIAKYAFPVIGKLAPGEIGVEHVRAVLKAAINTGAPDVARRVRARIEAILDDATAKGQRDPMMRNPADAGFHAFAKRKKGDQPHYRRMELDDELSEAPAIFRKLKELAASSTAISAWVFMIAAAARPSEAVNAQWSEIDMTKKLWVAPKERMKSNREHKVPLNSIAIEVLKRQETVRTGEAVFPGGSGSPISYNTFAFAPANAGIEAGTPHSWRSIFRDWAGNIGRIDRDLAEAALAHTLGGTEGAYRRLTAVEARRPAMEAYMNWLMGEGTNVITFKGRA